MKRSDISIFTKIPTLKTERLTMRALTVADAADMFEYSCGTAVPKYLLWSPHKDIFVTRSHLRYLRTQYAAGEYYDWALVLTEENKMIGTCGFSHFDLDNDSAEVGYVLNDKYWGKGYATEAVRRIVEFAFDCLPLNRLSLRILDGNDASVRVAERCGFRREGTHIDALLVKGHYVTYHDYALLRDEYINRR